MSKEYHRSAFCQRMLEACRRLAAEHFIRILFLTESVINTSPVWIGVITTLVIERMPLCATDKLTGSAVHLIITCSQRKCLYQQRTFTPTAACTIIVVVGIPVIYVFSEFTGEDALFRFVLLFVITRPAVDYIVMFLYTGRMHIGSGYRTSRIWIFFLRYFKCLQCKVEWITGLIQNRLPHQHGRMIAITTNHFTGILMNQFSEFRVFVPVLPARSSDDDKHAEFVTGIHKGWVLWIMRYTDDGTSCITQAFCVTPLL